MLEMIANELMQTNRVLDGILDDVSNSSPTIRPIVARYLSLKDGEVRARAALHFLLAKTNTYHAQAALALAVSTELTYTANKIHKEIFYLDETALHSGAAHLRVLTGDYLFSLSSIHVANSNHIPAMKVSINTLGKISEASLMITYDQIYQRLSQGYRYESYVKDIEQRIGGLFESAAEMGCLITEGSARLRQQACRFAIDLGTIQHLAKLQAEIAAQPPGEVQLSVDAAELLLVFWNELCVANGNRTNIFPSSAPGEVARVFYQAVGQVERSRHSINQLIDQKKQELVQRALAEIPESLTGTATGNAMAELVEVALRGQVN